MDKPAESRFPLHELIRDRWSPVAFDARPVEAEKIGSLLEAARWAPSSYNEQPWAFMVASIDDAIEHERMLGCLIEGNIPWAKNAPLLILSVAESNFSRNSKPNRHAFHDVGLANENIALQATALGLGVHMMAGFLPAKARELYEIPEGWEPLTILAIGYPGNLGDFPADLQSRDKAIRDRKPLSEIAFSGKWGTSLR